MTQSGQAVLGSNFSFKMNNSPLLTTKRLADAYNAKDWNIFADLLHSNAVHEIPDVENGGVERHQGVAEIIEYMKEWSTVIPDDKATFVNSQQIDAETVVCDVSYSGTRSGVPFKLQGINVEADGSSYSLLGSTTYKILDDKIVRITDRFNVADFLANFGIDS